MYNQSPVWIMVVLNKMFFQKNETNFLWQLFTSKRKNQETDEPLPKGPYCNDRLLSKGSKSSFGKISYYFITNL